MRKVQTMVLKLLLTMKLFWSRMVFISFSSALSSFLSCLLRTTMDFAPWSSPDGVMVVIPSCSNETSQCMTSRETNTLTV